MFVLIFTVFAVCWPVLDELGMRCMFVCVFTVFALLGIVLEELGTLSGLQFAPFRLVLEEL